MREMKSDGISFRSLDAKSGEYKSLQRGSQKITGGDVRINE